MTSVHSIQRSLRVPWCEMSDDLPVGPSLLEPGSPKRPDRYARMVLLPLLGILVLVLLVFYILFSFSRVGGDSMMPTLRPGERFLMTKTYRTPDTGDIVVFGRGEIPGESGGLIKRIVALPGDTILVTQGRATVNGVPEDISDVLVDPADSTVVGPLVVPDNTVFVMGDNRPVALDSRHIGPVSLSSIQGRVVFIWAPLDSMRAL